MEFRWIPGQGVDLGAIDRMKKHFARPSEAPPVAWFMSKVQEYHSDLLTVPVGQLTSWILEKYLEDTGSGIKNFGRFEEWVTWFQYLLPYILERILEENLLELTITYFVNLYPNGIEEEYAEFRDDVVRTLPQAIMSSELWHNSDISTENEWHESLPSGEPKHDWENAYRATMFFCLKYLTPNEITSWIASASDIRGDLWNYHLNLWVANAKEMINYLDNPSSIPPNTINKDLVSTEELGAYLQAAEINWESSYLNFHHSASKNPKPTELNDYFPRENVDAFLLAVKQFDLG